MWSKFGVKVVLLFPIHLSERAQSATINRMFGSLSAIGFTSPFYQNTFGLVDLP
jgi:hypothetical protein